MIEGKIRKITLKVTCIILMFVFGLSFNCFSQMSGKITYQAILESEDYKIMEGTLLFNTDSSLFYIENENYEKSVSKGSNKLNVEGSDDENIGFQIKPPDKPLIHEVNINRNLKQIRSRKNVYKMGEYLPSIVVEPTGTIDWKLINETEKIGPYSVSKAITTFRGRDYTAWYTSEIKVDAGPWKFQGLPGLILQVTDEEKGVSFIFSSATIPYELHNENFNIEENLVLSIDEYADLNDPETVSEEFINWLNTALPENEVQIKTSDISVNFSRSGIEKEFH